jgi:multidrug efflux pump subunit AcrB
MTVRKTGGVSTLAVVDGVRAVLPEIRALMPKGVDIKAIFDQSVFVKASLNSVLMGGAMAAGLTAMMILLFLGNWRLTLIILATIPLAIITAVLIMYEGGQTLNTMTLGGFALAVGILVDNGTVVIENIERHLHEGDGLTTAIVDGCGEVATPTVLSTISICIVFVPVFLLQGTAKYLFSPLSLSVCVSLIASLALSFTLVPVLFRALMRSTVEAKEARGGAVAKRSRFNIFGAFHHGFERRFHDFRQAYRNNVAYCVANPVVTGLFFLILLGFSLSLFPLLGERRPRAGSRRRSMTSPRSSARSARSWGPIRSTWCSTISACPTAASTSRSATPRPSGRWTAKFWFR